MLRAESAPTASSRRGRVLAYPPLLVLVLALLPVITLACGEEAPTETFDPLAVTTTAVPDGVPGAEYDGATLEATGGDGSYAWSVSAGALPDGLSLSSDGEITGTPTGTTATFTVQVTSGDGQTATHELTLTVSPLLELTTTDVPEGSVGLDYGPVALQATGGTGDYTWSVSAGDLPTGLGLDEDTGEISGTPTGAGSTFTVQVESDDGQTATVELTLTVHPALEVTTTELPSGVTGTTYGPETLSATGGDGDYTWSVSAGDLPAGLGLDEDSGEISGTPTGAGSTFTVEVESDDGQTATRELTIDVFAPLAVATTELPDGVRDEAYDTQTLAATGGDGDYTWTVSAGDLPDGLELDEDSGEISGTPTGAGSTFTVEVESGDGQTATQELTIDVFVLLTVTTTELPSGVTGTAYDTQTLAAAGGAGGYTWSVSAGDLPDGLELDEDTGEISGTPTGAGSTFTVEVESGDGQTATRELTIDVFAPLAVTTTELASGVAGVAYDDAVDATGGDGDYAWSVTVGTLPDGLELDGEAGEISGSATGTGSSTFTVEVVSGDGQSATQELTIEVFTPLEVTTTTLPSGITGTDYGTETVAATGGDGDYAWSVSAGSLPDGLELDEDTGEITGTPTAGGSTFTVEVESGDGQTDTQELTIDVFGPLAITTTSLPNAVDGADYDATVVATGGDGDDTWSVSAGSLPTGLELDEDTGEITGTPTGAGSTFTVQVESGDGQSDTQELTIDVFGALSVTTTSLPDGVEGDAYGPETLTATGGDSDYTWSVSVGALPDGLGLDDASGEIAGTPTDVGTTFTVQVESGDGQTATQELDIVIAPLLEPAELCSENPGIAVASFADANLDAVVRDELGIGGGEHITCAMLATLDDVDAGSSSIASIVGLQNLTGLTSLSLQINDITDISSLSDLTGLEVLTLATNTISDLSPLAGLTELTSLNVGGNAVTDISALSGLTGLENLYLPFNTISDLSPLAGLTALQELGLPGNSITDISPLASLTGLMALFLSSNDITDLAALEGLTGLAALTLDSNTSLADIDPLIDNVGLGVGSNVDLTNTSVLCADVTTLEANGVTVDSDCQQ